MKQIILFSVLILWGCSSKNTEWSSGQDAQSSFQEQRYQEQVENVRKQFPEPRPQF